MQRKMSKPLVLSLHSLLMLVAVMLMGLILTPRSSLAVVGEDCMGCHDEAVEAFVTSFHGRAWKDLAANGCQSCHGPTEKHLQSEDPVDILSYSVSHGADRVNLSRHCLQCHQRDINMAYWDMGRHSRNDVDCVSCHDIHVPKNKVDQLTVCIKCHPGIRTEIQKMSHHPIREGKIECKDCHNPHGTMERYMLRAESTNQLCYKCHAEKRGPFVYTHPPVEENCSICHTPHGSRNAKLMVQKIPNICQDCHDWSRHPGTPYDAKTGFKGRSPSNRFFARSCLNCHGAIHGSANFEHHALTR